MSAVATKKRPKNGSAKDVPYKATLAPNSTSTRPVDALTLRQQVTSNLAIWNNWRENLNPLLGLTLTRARYLLEQYPRGILADYAWTLFFIEQSDADLAALIERRTSALLEMDYSIKAPPKDKHGRPVDAGLAKEQTACLQEAYDGIDNLYDAIEHLALATFRGYALAEKWVNADGDITHLEIVDPWNVVRQGLKGPWKYNPQATSGEYMSYPAADIIDPSDFLIRDVRRPVGRIALLKFIRQNLAEKDWDAFVEIYGIPGWVIVGPPNVATENEKKYEAAARDIAQGGSGYLPNGATATAADGPRGNSPFAERMKYLSEKLILAGTGGKLTMLAESGSGTLAGNAHQETFEMIARSEARKLNEVFQRQLDASVLERNFPGQPRVAYFELSANEETDVAAFIGDVEKLGRAGYVVDEAQIEEKTGYKATLQPIKELPKDSQPVPAGDETVKPLKKPDPAAITNRARGSKADDLDMGEFLANARIDLQGGIATDFEPLADAIETVLNKPDAEFAVSYAVLKAHWPTLVQQILKNRPATTKAYLDILGPALADGLASGGKGAAK